MPSANHKLREENLHYIKHQTFFRLVIGWGEMKEKNHKM